MMMVLPRRRGGAYGVFLDGVNDYLLATSQASINFVGDYTVLVYFDSETHTTSNSYPVLLAKAAAGTGYGLQQIDSPFFSSYIETASRQAAFSALNIASQAGLHVFGGGRETSNIHYFFDGTRGDAVAASSDDLTNAGGLIVGNYTPADTNGAIKGTLRAIAMWNRLLSASEAENFPATVPASGLVAHWPFTEGAGSTVADVVGGATLTITGGVWVAI